MTEMGSRTGKVQLISAITDSFVKKLADERLRESGRFFKTNLKKYSRCVHSIDAF